MGQGNDIPQAEQLLIGSKLECPPLPDELVSRPRLIERLDAGMDGRVTLIAAPAGYGKTSLAIQWLSGLPRESAWFALDRADRDPTRFARYLAVALSRFSGNGFRRSRALLEARAVRPWAYLTEVLVSELQDLRDPAVLVLEDYHNIDKPEIHELVEQMVEGLPPAVHVVVMTRVDPPWPTMRWRTRGWLSQLRASDLRFSVEETEAFFSVSGRQTLDRATVELLQRRTEGWIAGLRLAQLSLLEQDDPDRKIKELPGTDRHIADYLMDEVLAGQSADVLEFLAASALMERFNPSLMDRMLSDHGHSRNARQILAEIEREHLFLVALDNRRQWYRWHHLFHDLLLDHLEDLASPEFRSRVDREAGAWFAQEGLVEEALRHWIAAGELDAAAELVGTHLHSVIAEDMSCRRLTEWLSMFPPGATHGRLPLLVAEGYCSILRWDLQGLEAVVREADEIDTNVSRGNSSGGANSLRSDIDALGGFLLYWRGDAEGSLERSRRALDGNPKVGTRPWVLASVYRSGALVLCGRFDEAVRRIDEAIAAAGPGSPGVADLLMAQAFFHLYALDLDSCRARSLQMLDLDERVSVVNSRLGHAPYLLGLVAYERNLLDEAEAWFRRVEDLRYVVPSSIFKDALIGQALIALARNDRETLQAYCRDARAFAIEVGDAASLGLIRSFELRAALLRGLPPPHGMAPPPADDHQSFWLEVPTVTWAMHLIAHAAARVRGSALDYIDEALARMERYHNQRVATVLAVLRALALDVRGEREAALDSLAATVRVAKPQGLVRSFVDCGPRVKELLDELMTRSDPEPYIQSLRAAFGSTKHDSTALRPSEVLTYRELETLELLAWRMTNKEIAAKLSVSPAAIKKRLESIYAKLDARDRRAAVAAAVSKGLIDSPVR